MYLDVKINNVPVQLEVKNVGPASLEDIDHFREKLRSGELVLVDQGSVPASEEVPEVEEDPVVNEVPSSNPYFTKTDEVRDEIQKEAPNLPEEVETVSETPEKPDLSNLLENIVEDAPEIIEDVKEIFESNKDPNNKPWYKSKTIISNTFAAVGCILGTLVADNPEVSMYLPASVLAIINLYLRVSTKGTVNLPLEGKFKRIKKVKEFIQK